MIDYLLPGLDAVLLHGERPVDLSRGDLIDNWEPVPAGDGGEIDGDTLIHIPTWSRYRTSGVSITIK